MVNDETDKGYVDSNIFSEPSSIGGIFLKIIQVIHVYTLFFLAKTYN